MNSLFNEISTHLTNLFERSSLDKEVLQSVAEKIHYDFLPLVLLTNTIERIYSKPRGYAGDFLMIEGIYNNEPSGVGRVGPFIDELFLEMPPARAVRNRRHLIMKALHECKEKANKGKLNITSLASGPAREIFEYLEMTDVTSTIPRFNLVDLDLESLAYVENKANRHKVRKHLNLFHGNLVKLITGRDVINLPPQNFVYSIGLIDYFNDKFVISLLNYVYNLLAEDGVVMLGNFHIKNPTKSLMDHILDWKLIHRDEGNMHALFEKSHFKGRDVKIIYDEEGINMFASCAK